MSHLSHPAESFPVGLPAWPAQAGPAAHYLWPAAVQLHGPGLAYTATQQSSLLTLIVSHSPTCLLASPKSPHPADNGATR